MTTALQSVYYYINNFSIFFLSIINYYFIYLIAFDKLNKFFKIKIYKINFFNINLFFINNNKNKNKTSRFY